MARGTRITPHLIVPESYHLYLLAGTRQTFKTGVKTLGGPDQFPAPKSPSENNYYLFNSRF